MLGFSSAVAVRGVSSDWDPIIYQAAGGDPFLIVLAKAVIAHESEWNPNAQNPADPSYGLMQILWGVGGPYPSYTTQQLLDPITNLELGIQFLRDLRARYAVLEDVIASYNAGSPRKNAAGLYVNSRGSTQVQDYVDDVLAYYDWYAANDPLVAAWPGSDVPTAEILRDSEAWPDAGGDVGQAGLIAIGVAAALALAWTGRRGGP